MDQDGAFYRNYQLRDHYIMKVRSRNTPFHYVQLVFGLDD